MREAEARCMVTAIRRGKAGWEALGASRQRRVKRWSDWWRGEAPGPASCAQQRVWPSGPSVRCGRRSMEFSLIHAAQPRPGPGTCWLETTATSTSGGAREARRRGGGGARDAATGAAGHCGSRQQHTYMLLRSLLCKCNIVKLCEGARKKPAVGCAGEAACRRVSTARRRQPGAIQNPIARAGAVRTAYRGLREHDARSQRGHLGAGQLRPPSAAAPLQLELQPCLHLLAARRPAAGYTRAGAAGGCGAAVGHGGPAAGQVRSRRRRPGAATAHRGLLAVPPDLLPGSQACS